MAAASCADRDFTAILLAHICHLSLCIPELATLCGSRHFRDPAKWCIAYREARATTALVEIAHRCQKAGQCLPLPSPCVRLRFPQESCDLVNASPTASPAARRTAHAAFPLFGGYHRPTFTPRPKTSGPAAFPTRLTPLINPATGETFEVDGFRVKVASRLLVRAGGAREAMVHLLGDRLQSRPGGLRGPGPRAGQVPSGPPLGPPAQVRRVLRARPPRALPPHPRRDQRGARGHGAAHGLAGLLCRRPGRLERALAGRRRQDQRRGVWPARRLASVPGLGPGAAGGARRAAEAGQRPPGASCC